MKKYDELLKKVEMFEKLATYGNRREFLKSIAQSLIGPAHPSADSTKDVKPFTAKQLDEAAKAQGRPVPSFQSTDPNAPNYMDPKFMNAPPAPNTKKYQGTWSENGLTYGDEPKTTEPHAAAEQAYNEEKAKGYHSMVGEKSPTPVAKTRSPQFNGDVWRAQIELDRAGLGALLGPSGIDGVLGRDTIKALKAAKPDMTATQAIAALNEQFNEPAATPLAAPPSNPVSTWGNGLGVRENPF